MKKRNIIIMSLLLVIMIYFIIQYIAYKKYNKISYPYQMNVEEINVKNTTPKKYLAFNGISISSSFNKYEYNEEDDTYVLYDNENSQIEMFTVSNCETYIDIFTKGFDTYYQEEESILSETKLNKIIDRNNITNDIELLEYLYTENNKSINIFTPISKMKENNYVKEYVSNTLPLVYNYKEINGDYEGILLYTLSSEEYSSYDVNLYNNGKRYVLTFIGDYLQEEDILKLVSTVVFK